MEMVAGLNRNFGRSLGQTLQEWLVQSDVGRSAAERSYAARAGRNDCCVHADDQQQFALSVSGRLQARLSTDSSLKQAARA